MIIAFLVLDGATPPFLSNADEPGALWAILMGIAIGQINLIATWTTLAPGNFVQRFSWSLLLIVWTWYAYVIGLRSFSDRPMTQTEAVGVGFLLLSSFLTAQIPLWIAGKMFRWRLVSWLGSTERRVRFRLTHLLWAMLAIALTIAPGKLILPSGDWNVFVLFRDEPMEAWIFLGVVLLMNILITIPGLWIAFARPWNMALAIMAWLIYCSVITGTEIAIVLFMEPGADEFMEVYFIVWLINFTQFAVVYGALAIFRSIGFQLVHLPRKREIVKSVMDQ
jgi:hypothetical protein